MLNTSIPTDEVSDTYASAQAFDEHLAETQHPPTVHRTGGEGGGSGEEALADPPPPVVGGREHTGTGLAERLVAVRVNFVAGQHSASALAPIRPQLLVSNALDMDALGLRNWTGAQSPEGSGADPQQEPNIQLPAQQEEQLAAATAPSEAAIAALTGPLPQAQADHSLPADGEPATIAQQSAPPLAPEIAQAVPPLVNAFGAAAQIAADANAAAAALENLKRLLEDRLSAAAHVPGPDAGLHRAADRSNKSPKPLRAVLRSAADHGVSRHTPPAPESWHKDLRGFFAGMAISAAFGVIFYLFMIAG
jgi:hypothetical protein